MGKWENAISDFLSCRSTGGGGRQWQYMKDSRKKGKQEGVDREKRERKEREEQRGHAAEPERGK